LVIDAKAGTASCNSAGWHWTWRHRQAPILEAGMRTLRAQGVEHAMLNGGGDVLVAGRLQGRPWRVGLRDPRAPERLLGVLALEGRGHRGVFGRLRALLHGPGRAPAPHPEPGHRASTQGPRGVSLLARDAASVNGLGTALMVMGSAAAPRCCSSALACRPWWSSATGIWQTPGMAAVLPHPEPLPSRHQGPV
jgi:thiamine biosynthesis lipoprotein